MKKNSFRNFLNKITNYLPLLDLRIEIPFISIRTNFLYRRYESNSIEYITLDIHIFKWFFEFKLYDTFRRIEDRE